VAKRKRKRRSGGTLILIAIALLIAGFVVRRTMLPQFLHYLAYRPAANPSPPISEAPIPEEPRSRPVAAEPSAPQRSAAPVATPLARKSAAPPSEHLTQSDQQQLEDILKRKRQ
jgi:hypothetical protein